MKFLSETERKLVRLAFSSKNKDLRKKAVRHVVLAHYSKEFTEWAKNQGDVFTNPDTGNKVRFNSLPSKAHKELYRRWKGGEYKHLGGPSPGERSDATDAPDRGVMYADRTELRGKPKKKMEESAGLSEEELESMLPVSRIKEHRHGSEILKGLRGASFHDLDALHEATKFIVENPDDDYSKNHWLKKHVGLSSSEMKTLHKGLSKKLVDAKGRKYNQTVLSIANDNDLEGIDADAVRQFRLDKPARGRALSPEELKKKFLEGPWAKDPEVRDRIQKMTPEEFMAMRNSILEDEEEESLVVSPPRKATEELSLFDLPPKGKKTSKKATLSPVGRELVRIAHLSKDPEVRKKIAKLLVK